MLGCTADEITIQDEIVFRTAQKTDITWEKLVETAFLYRVMPD